MRTPHRSSQLRLYSSEKPRGFRIVLAQLLSSSSRALVHHTRTVHRLPPRVFFLRRCIFSAVSGVFLGGVFDPFWPAFLDAHSSISLHCVFNLLGRLASLLKTFCFIRPKKQPMHEPIINEDDEMAEVEDDPLSKLMTRLPRLKRGIGEIYWDLRVFGLPPHVVVYITFNDALEIIGGDRMLNISIIQLWCMYMDTIILDQDRSSLYVFVESHSIQSSGNTIENKQKYLQTWMTESNRDVYLVPYIDG
ncbi:hypothetical protein LR48_Vigan07g160600 [Vigna angularis]|uniref:Uncharacterized protein n=1 Tax=Phaseolus angularis TaxID=3914 RepID=A0A0L9UZ85_PHAAN|nr:hypothetical protein LR48_Vigan07g160600 [Vigna angularis]